MKVLNSKRWQENAIDWEWELQVAADLPRRTAARIKAHSTTECSKTAQTALVAKCKMNGNYSLLHHSSTTSRHVDMSIGVAVLVSAPSTPKCFLWDSLLQSVDIPRVSGNHLRSGCPSGGRISTTIRLEH